jgi:hypothetical protein
LVLYSPKTTWVGVFPDRGDHEHRVREPVDRAPTPVTVEDELAVLAERFVPADRRVPYGFQLRIQAASRMSVVVMTMLDVVTPG